MQSLQNESSFQLQIWFIKAKDSFSISPRKTFFLKRLHILKNKLCLMVKIKNENFIFSTVYDTLITEVIVMSIYRFF